MDEGASGTGAATRPSREDEDPGVERRYVDVGEGRRVSVLSFGDGEPRAVLLHGRGQNAYTWSGVARALGDPVLAVDLPGHGHSDWREDHDYGPWTNADAVASVIAELAPAADVVVGMSLGGMTLIGLAARYPDLVRRAVVIDTTPANRDTRPPLSKDQRGATALLEGPKVFDSFEDILAATAAAVPGRSPESLRAGVMRNARQLEDGRWTWRYDRERAPGGGTPQDRTLLWGDLEAVAVPVMLVYAGRSGRVLDEDVAEFVRRRPGSRVEFVADSGHSVQSDQPVLLARLIEDFVATTT